MINMDATLSIIVLSCDKYSDLWSDFFMLRDKFWSDCDYKWYLVTESLSFEYPGVSVINTGKNLNWTGRLKFALSQIKSQYIGWYLDDFFISERVDNIQIHQLVDKMVSDNIDYINVSDVFDSLVKMPEPHKYYDEHLFVIPKHKKYGISTAAALWNKDYLRKILGDNDKNAWQFEIDLCNQALSDEGIPGTILCDDRKPFKVTPVPVVIQGKYYPKSIRLFKRKGITLNTGERSLMSFKDVIVYDVNSLIRSALRSHPNLSKCIKWIAKNIFNVKFFT